MKKVLTMVLVIVMVFMATAPVSAAKTVKGTRVIACPCCDGTSHDCPYWYINKKGKGKHMSEKQIEEFLFIESHYQDENGEWHER